MSKRRAYLFHRVRRGEAGAIAAWKAGVNDSFTVWNPALRAEGVRTL